MKVFITKWALTTGIEEAEGEICKDFSDDMVLVRRREPESGLGFSQYFDGKGRDWHDTLESAKDKAEIMRTKKIASLKKQIAKLEKMQF